MDEEKLKEILNDLASGDYDLIKISDKINSL